MPRAETERPPEPRLDPRVVDVLVQEALDVALPGSVPFSTLMLETLNLALSKEHDRAFFNLVGSFSIGLGAFLFGAYLGALAV